MWYILNSSDGKRYPITAEGITIGREGCAILTPASDSRASRQHAMVRLQNDYVEVQDLDSTNGTYIEEQRLYIMTPWSQGQVLRCGETTFQLIGEPIPQRNSPTLVSSTNDTMMSSTYMKSPVVSQPTPQPVSPPVQQYVPPSPSAQSSPNISPQINFQKQPQQGTFQPESATNNTSAIIGIIFGILMLIIGLVGWQHYQPQMNNFNSMLGQFTVAIGGDKVSRQFSEIKLYYTGSIVLACIGGIMVLASAIRLAVARK